MMEFPSGPSTHAGTAEEQLAPSLHRLPGGGHVAYRFLPGHAPTVAFLCGYASEMTGTKARFLHRVCAEAGHACARFASSTAIATTMYRGVPRLASRLRSDDVTVEIVRDGEHRLSRDADLARLARTLRGVLGGRDA